MALRQSEIVLHYDAATTCMILQGHLALVWWYHAMMLHEYMQILACTGNEYKEMLNFEMIIREPSRILLIMIGNLYFTRSLNFLSARQIQVNVSPN